MRIRDGRPAIDVKVYKVEFPLKFRAAIEARLEKTATQDGVTVEALETEAFNHAQESWWNDAGTLAEATFKGRKVEIHSDGRMGGWLVVSGLGNPSEWKGGPEEEEMEPQDLRPQWDEFEVKIAALLKKVPQRYLDEAEELCNISETVQADAEEGVTALYDAIDKASEAGILLIDGDSLKKIVHELIKPKFTDGD
jgi:hypothetical protein